MGGRVILAVFGLLVAPAWALPASGEGACEEPTWLVGLVHDVARSGDFVADVGHMVAIRDRIDDAACLASARLLAFSDGEAWGHEVFAPATEAALKAAVVDALDAASATEGGRVILLLSSHGFVYTALPPCTAGYVGGRMGGSYALLAPGDGEDGHLYDCELAEVLARAAHVPVVLVVDCSVCGGFSDSITAVSGTVSDGALHQGSGLVRADRVVMTGCAMTTECFSRPDGSVFMRHLRRALDTGADGWTAPLYPRVQGATVPVHDEALVDGRVSASEWFFAAQADAMSRFDAVGLQQAFRIKSGFASVAEEPRIA